MKNLTMSLELLQPLNPLYLSYLFIQEPAASKGPAAHANSEDSDSEYRDEKSARSQDSERTVLYYPDLFVLTDVEHRAVTPGTHKYAAAARSFCFVTTETAKQQDVCNLNTAMCGGHFASMT